MILPLGLLTAFRLGGIIKEPLTISENKTLEGFSWSIERPIGPIGIKESLTKVYDEDILANFTVFIDDYDGSDVMTQQINVSAYVSGGFVSFVNITFWEDYKDSQVNFFEDIAWPKYYASPKNLSIIRHDDRYLSRGLKAFVELAGVNSPKSVSFGCFVDWILRSPQNYTHQLEIRFELIYFNGTAYKRIVQPFQLKVGPDDNNSLEKAEEIVADRTYSMLYIGPNDIDDYYRVYLNEGSTVTIKLRGIAPPALCNLELYDIDGKLVAYSNYDVNHNITYTISSSGYWLIRVHQIVNFGFYYLTVETHTRGEV